MECTDTIRICRVVHKDQLCKAKTATESATPNEEAGAAEGWVTTGSRRLSRETRTWGHP